MKSSNQINNQTEIELGVTFNRSSRENYFEMREVALRNLSIVDQKNDYQKVMDRKQVYSYSN